MTEGDAIKAASDLQEWCKRNRHGGCVNCPFALDLGVCWFPVDDEPYSWDVEYITEAQHDD